MKVWGYRTALPAWLARRRYGPRLKRRIAAKLRAAPGPATGPATGPAALAAPVPARPAPCEARAYERADNVIPLRRVALLAARG